MATSEHHIDQRLLDRRVTIHLVGVGGNGAQMAACLARLDIAIRALGHPHGLFVQAFDPDVVTDANVGRQLYSPSDIGGSKSVITITRLNHFYGLDWEAITTRIEDHWERPAHRNGRDGDILISCVDSRAARRHMHEYLFSGDHYSYWLDLGNNEQDGQVVLGTPRSPRADQASGENARLPCVTELYPELLDTRQPDENVHSCSVRLSLAAQGLFVNDFVVRYAAQLLYELFSRGRLTLEASGLHASHGAAFTNTFCTQLVPGGKQPPYGGKTSHKYLVS
jgi:PRTRC genetic system ThiF family protein